MTRATRRRLAAAVAAVALAGIGLAMGWSALSAALVALPVLAPALMPDPSTRTARAALAAGVAAGAALPTLLALPLCLRYDAWPVWWSALLRGWCGAGIGAAAVAAALLAQRGGGGRWWRALRAAGAVAVVGAACLTLSSLYLAQLTGDESAGVAALTVREEVVIALPDGDRLAARLYLPRSGTAADGRPRGWALFVHGAGGWKEAWPNHLRLFAEAGWAVVAYDQRGHGRSSPAALSYGPREAEDVVAMWRELRARAGGRPLAVYGVSMGSCATMLAAPRLTGCAAILLESPFDELDAMLRQRLSPPLRALAIGLARAGPGGDPRAVRPGAALAAASAGERAPRVLIGWIAADASVPAGQSRAVAARLPAATSFESPHGEHLDLIVHPPWRARAAALLAAAEAGP